MKNANKTPPPPKRRIATQRTVKRLLSAVDRSIAAANEARQARDELIRLAAKKQESSS